MYEADIQKYSGIMMNLERQINMLESSTIDNQVLQGYKAAATAVKQIHGGASVEDIEETLDEIQESMAMGEEISAALSNPIGSTVGEVSSHTCPSLDTTTTTTTTITSRSRSQVLLQPLVQPDH
jgi:charged multivesicular body protein 4